MPELIRDEEIPEITKFVLHCYSQHCKGKKVNALKAGGYIERLGIDREERIRRNKRLLEQIDEIRQTAQENKTTKEFGRGYDKG